MAKKIAAAQKLDAFAVASKLAAMPKLDDINEFAPLILDLMQGVPVRVWVELDEKPGRFNYMDDRFYMLRQVRNNAEFGAKLFAGFSGR